MATGEDAGLDFSACSGGIGDGTAGRVSCPPARGASDDAHGYNTFGTTLDTASARQWCKAGGLRGRNFERADVTSLKDDLRCGCIMRERLADGDHGV